VSIEITVTVSESGIWLRGALVDPTYGSVERWSQLAQGSRSFRRKLGRMDWAENN